MKKLANPFLFVAVVAFATVSAAADPAVVCESGKLKIAGKYGACRLNAQSKSVKSGGAPDYAKCDASFTSKWQGSETKAGPAVCPSEGDAASVAARIVDHDDALAALLGGDPVPAPQHFAASGQTVNYGPGSDGAVQAGAPLSFVDNADGTITDENTGLMWEKKYGFDATLASLINCSNEGECFNPHNANNQYTWTITGVNMDGTLQTLFLDQLNNRCNDLVTACTVDADCTVPGGPCGFAGHRDWRIPNRRELESLVDSGRLNPAIDPAFHGASCGPACVDITSAACSCTAYKATAGLYTYSSTTSLSNPTFAWSVPFDNGNDGGINKSLSNTARAVRTAS
jgi:hypothetical protein